MTDHYPNVRTEGKPGMVLTDPEADPIKHAAATRKGGLMKKLQSQQAGRAGRWRAVDAVSRRRRAAIRLREGLAGISDGPEGGADI